MSFPPTDYCRMRRKFYDYEIEMNWQRMNSGVDPLLRKYTPEEVLVAEKNAAQYAAIVRSRQPEYEPYPGYNATRVIEVQTELPPFAPNQHNYCRSVVPSNQGMQRYVLLTKTDYESSDDDDDCAWDDNDEDVSEIVVGQYSAERSTDYEGLSLPEGVSVVSPTMSAYRSEVLGPLANAWMESDEMLCGGGRNMRKKGRARMGNKRKGVRGFSAAPVAVNRSGTFAPDRQRTSLRYEQIFTLPVATGIAPWGLEQLKLSAPPNLTTVPTTIRGFAALLADYRKYRMAKFKLKFTVVNRDLLVPIEIFLAPVNSQPPTTTDPSKYIETLRPHSRKSLSFAPGMNVGSVTLSISLPKFAGAANSTIDDNYTGLMDGSSDPPNNVWCLYGYRTFGGGAITLGPSASISVVLDGDFYELQSPAN